MRPLGLVWALAWVLPRALLPPPRGVLPVLAALLLAALATACAMPGVRCIERNVSKKHDSIVLSEESVESAVALNDWAAVLVVLVGVATVCVYQRRIFKV